MNYSDLEEAAAEFLIAARRVRRAGDRLPVACRPGDIDSALAIQRRVSEILAEPVGGWKAAMPSPGKIMLAPIYAASIYCDSPCMYRTSGSTARVEPEVAFVLGNDLGPRSTAYADDEVVAAIAETRLVLELLGGRYADLAAVSFPEKLADGLNNQGLFVGPVVADGLERTLDAFPLTIEGPGLLVSRDGRHPAGHPLAPLFWSANFLAARGEGLRAGQVVTTGSYCGALELPLATPLTVTFDGLGSLAVEFVPADGEMA